MEHAASARLTSVVGQRAVCRIRAEEPGSPDGRQGAALSAEQQRCALLQARVAAHEATIAEQQATIEQLHHDGARRAASIVALGRRLRECQRERDQLRVQHAAVLAVDAKLDVSEPGG